MRFNNRACALMDIPDLPQSAFEHIGDGKIKPQGGGGGIPIVSDVVNVVSDIGESFDKAVTQPVGRALAEADKTINREVPGGWVTLGLTAAGAAAYVAAADAAVAAGLSATEAAAAGSAAAQAAETAALLDAAALAEGGVTAGMGAAANTGIPAGTTLLGGGSSLIGGAEFLPTGEDFYMGEFLPTGEDFNMGVSLGDADIQPGGFYGGGATPKATILPGELGDIILDASGNVVTSSGADILAAPSSFSISPMQAIQGLRAASGLLGGQQQQPQIPQMQMGSRTQMPQGAVDYSGLYNLLATQRPQNPNSLLG